MFGCPGDSPIDGSAHIIKDRGFLFLFRRGFDKGVNQTTALRASIPVNRWIYLNESPDALYRITEVYPCKGKPVGVYRYGDTFSYDMPAEPAVIPSLAPAVQGSTPQRPAGADPQEKVLVVPAFRTVPPATRRRSE